MAQRETSTLNNFLEDIETLKEGCRLLDEIRSLGGYYELRDYIDSHFKQADKNKRLTELHGHEGLITRLDRYFKFDDSE